MFSEDLMMQEIDKEWNAIAWAAKRDLVKSSKKELVKHLMKSKQFRVAMAVNCGCSLCLNAVSHLSVKK